VEVGLGEVEKEEGFSLLYYVSFLLRDG